MIHMEKMIDFAFLSATLSGFDRDVLGCAERGLSKAETARHMEVSPKLITNWCRRHPEIKFVSGNKGMKPNPHRKARNRVLREQMNMTQAELDDYRLLREKGKYSPEEAADIIASHRKTRRLTANPMRGKTQ